MKTEYNASTTNYPGCGYRSINQYKSSSFQGPGYADAVNSHAGHYIVPDINPVLSYDTLVKGHSTNGYATIASAYGPDAQDCCPKYKKMSCSAEQAPCVQCTQVQSASYSSCQ